jgi:MbtH protein
MNSAQTYTCHPVLSRQSAIAWLYIEAVFVSPAIAPLNVGIRESTLGSDKVERTEEIGHGCGRAMGETGFGGAKRRHSVVVNDEEQYSIWPADREKPPGWYDVGVSGSTEECLAYIETVWTDMRPKSLRRDAAPPVG